MARWIRPQKRLAIYLRDDFQCAYCGQDLHHADAKDVTLDHLIPRINGGSNDETNLVTCCQSCNSQRQDTPLVQWAGKQTADWAWAQAAKGITAELKLAKAIIGG